MVIGRPLSPLTLCDEERETSTRWARRPTSAQALALRSRIVLACADGKSNHAVAAAFGVVKQAVGKWRARFIARRFDGLVDEPRPGAPRKISDAEVERVVTLTLEATPVDATNWSTRSMAAQTGMSQSAITHIWRAFALQPHRAEMFKLSSDPLFIEKVRDIVGLYLHPPHRVLVLCVDEKSQIQALARTAPLLPMRPGQIERRTHDSPRHGTTSLFGALDVKTGEVVGPCRRRHRSVKFRRFLDQIDAAVHADLDVHLVLDDCVTHKAALIPRCLAQHPRYRLHFTPTSSSWLNSGGTLVRRLDGETNCSAGSSTAPGNWNKPSPATLTSTARIPSHSSGPRPQNRYPQSSPAIAYESLTQDTRTE